MHFPWYVSRGNRNVMKKVSLRPRIDPLIDTTWRRRSGKLICIKISFSKLRSESVRRRRGGDEKRSPSHIIIDCIHLWKLSPEFNLVFLLAVCMQIYTPTFCSMRREPRQPMVLEKQCWWTAMVKLRDSAWLGRVCSDLSLVFQIFLNRLSALNISEWFHGILIKFILRFFVVRIFLWSFFLCLKLLSKVIWEIFNGANGC